MPGGDVMADYGSGDDSRGAVGMVMMMYRSGRNDRERTPPHHFSPVLPAHHVLPQRKVSWCLELETGRESKEVDG